jgi:phage FluMu gp28-like protein
MKAAVPRAVKPGLILFDYQKKWAEDSSRWKFGLMARQVGKDFAAGFEGIRECFEAELQKKKPPG